MTSEAEKRLGVAISLDLFATADNTLVPRFFVLYQEPLAEGADALAQLDWGGLAAHTAASSTARVHMRSRREACWRRFVLRRPTWCHHGPLRAVGPGVANAHGHVPHVCRRTAGPVCHRA